MIKRVLLTITVLAGVFCGVMLVQKVGKWKLDYDILHAAAGGDADEIKRLLDRGANPNAEHIEGSSALWHAVVSGNLKAVQTLLDHGANPNSCGQFDSVLHDAINIAEQESSRYKDRTYAVDAC